ncbi:MAG TPA: iron-containing alcohol dehydrogenase [Anaerovoracaceae bacterium]|nr:iron-containing alcohol dehydrogenase [Anaerovoracaceae bacterium]
MTLSKYSFVIPTRIEFGDGCIAEVGKEAKALGAGKVMIVADKGVIGAGLVKPVIQALEKESLKYCIFDEVLPNPRDIHCQAGYEFAVKEKIDVIVAVGGGSSMDTAKAIGVLLTHEGPIQNYCGTDLLTRDITPLIAIPTTAGTGSEVTPFAVITDTQKHVKLNVVDNRVAPRVALVDPCTLLNLPSHIMAACGIDAMTHAVEAYTCKIANPHTDAFALYAIEIIQKSLRGAVDSPNIENCSDMMLGSTIAGLAFGFSDTAGVHCMAEALGGRYDLPHGVANAILLPTVTEFNVPADIVKYAKVAEALGIDTSKMTREEAAKAVPQGLEQLCMDVHIPKMKDFEVIKPEDFEELAVAAEKNVSTPDNPMPVTAKEFLKLFHKAYEGK